jgi:hypothetical protein
MPAAASPDACVEDALRVPKRRGAEAVVLGVTTAVAFEVAELEPYALEAVTRTRILEPTSVGSRVYVDAVAPRIATQFLPNTSQRRQ